MDWLIRTLFCLHFGFNKCARQFQRCNFLVLLKIVLISFLFFAFVYVIFQIMYSPISTKIIILDTANGKVHAGIWDIKGFKYFKNLRTLSQQQPQLSVPDVLSRKSKTEGLWFLSREEFSNQSTNSITLSEFQNGELQEVSIALRLYIFGKNKLNKGSNVQVKLRDGITITSQTFVISARNFNDDGFCNYIVPLNRFGFIDQIEISGEILSNDSFILIDKITVILAEIGTSKSFMYTLVPNHWCNSNDED